MVTKLTLDKAGRVVLPKPVRDELRLAAGDSLELESNDSEIVLRPVRGSHALHKKDGVWVYGAGKPLNLQTVNDTVRSVREERDRDNLRKTR